MCSRKDAAGNYYIDDDVVVQTVELTRYLMREYDVPADNVLRHYDVWDKKCPEPFVRNPELWENFKKRITGDDELMSKEYDELKAEIETLKSNAETVYHYTADVPEWGRATVQKLLDRGIFTGEAADDLNLPETMLRIMVINDRAGLYE